MSKAIGIDFGLKRTGISISDELRIIATPLTTIPSEELIRFLKEYIQASFLCFYRRLNLYLLLLSY